MTVTTRNASRAWQAAGAEPAKPIPKTPSAVRKRASGGADDGGASGGPAADEDPRQWTALLAWWAVHAVSNGVGRVAFDVYLPFAPDATPTHIAHLLAVGTIATVRSKACKLFRAQLTRALATHTGSWQLTSMRALFLARTVPARLLCSALNVVACLWANA